MKAPLSSSGICVPVFTNIYTGLFLWVSSLFFWGCGRNEIEAQNLAIEAGNAKKSNPDEAISKFEQASQLDPKNHTILWDLGLMYEKKERWSDAATAFTKAEKIAPTFANYSFHHGMSLARAAVKGPASWSDAKAPLEDAIRKDPNYADAYYELADVLLHLDDEKGALVTYLKAIEVRPDKAAFYVTPASHLIRLGFLAQAEQLLKEGIKQIKDGDKHAFELHSLLGQVFEFQKNSAQAIVEYELAKKNCGECSESGQPIAYLNLGGAYAAAGRKAEAIQYLQQFQKKVCKTAQAARYQDECSQAQALASKTGETLK